MIKKVKGTQDILSMEAYDAVIALAQDHFATANFRHIQTPLIEQLALFKRSVGEDTDIVGKEMYTFATNDRETLCLRPEATASTIRAYCEAALTDKPWCVFSHGPMFRHERPQKGRWRQFSQFNIEAINSSSVALDARFIALLDAFFSERCGFKEYVLSINFLGNSADRRAHKEALRAFLAQHQEALCATCQQRTATNILRIFDCKSPSCQSLYQNAPLLTDYLGAASKAEWAELNYLLDVLSINRIHNPLLVRGLDYYNNVVFEFSSPLLGAQNTFCGGGRYDLSAAFERKEPLPSIGAAIGVERLLLLLQEAGSPLLAPKKRTVVGILPFEQTLMPLALLADQTLRRHHIPTTLLTDGLKKGMKKANADGLPLLLLIGAQEQAEGTITVKDMVSGTEHRTTQESLVSCIQLLTGPTN